MKHLTIEPEIYSYHIDSGRHVSNIVYIKWMEVGRIKLLEEIGLPLHALEREGIAPALTHTDIHYIKPLYLGDKVRLDLHLSELKRISGKINFTFYRSENEVVARAVQDAVFFKLETKRPYKFSDEQRARLLPYLVEPEKSISY